MQTRIVDKSLLVENIIFISYIGDKLIIKTHHFDNFTFRQGNSDHAQVAYNLIISHIKGAKVLMLKISEKENKHQITSINDIPIYDATK